MAEEFRSIFTTPFGPGDIYASDQGIFKVDLPDICQCQATFQKTAAKFKGSCLTEIASQLLQKYFLGEHIEFKDIPVDLAGITRFRRKALLAIRDIPYGDVRSYGQIAALIGTPLAARAVGGAMASNPIPIIIPCHRIVGSDGRLTGFSAPGGEGAKRVLLKMEGVEFKGLLAIKKSWL